MYLGARLRSFAPRLTLIALCALCAPAGADAASSSSEAGVRVDARTRATVAFGRFVYGAGDELPEFIPTDRVDMIPGHSYGWRLRVDTTEPMITFRERVQLPSPARSWGVTPDTTVAGDRASAITISQAYVPAHGVIDHGWTFVEGDPRGVYRFDVAVNGVHVGAANLHVR